MKPILHALLCLAAAGSVACGSDDKSGTTSAASSACSNDTTAETYVAGLSKTTAGGLKVEIESAMPAPPRLGYNQWTLRITDASGNPVTGATVKVVCLMVHTGAFSHGCAVTPDVLELGNGEYQAGDLDKDAGVAAIVFNMAGHWEITITVDRASMPQESAKFVFCL